MPHEPKVGELPAQAQSTIRLPRLPSSGWAADHAVCYNGHEMRQYALLHEANFVEELRRLDNGAGELGPARTDEIAEKLYAIAQWMFDMVNLQGGGPDEAPEPASQFDYNLSQAAGEVQHAALQLTSKPLGGRRG